MPKAPFSNYKTSIEKYIRAGNATEHTYRHVLITLLESLGTNIAATNEPKREKCGAPDFIITQRSTPLGYIEAKDIDTPLDKELQSDQMQRYLSGLCNLILTDYLEFRWFVSGEHRLTVRLGDVTKGGKIKLDKEGPRQLLELLTSFLKFDVPTVRTPKDLAARMASLAKLIHSTILAALAGESKTGSLHHQMEGFRTVLIHDLSEDQFADMYAQTICYGLFAARCNPACKRPFAREHAAYDLPKTNPFLRKMFSYIAGPDLDERITWVVDDLAEVLNRADIGEILKDFGKRARKEDPVVHFYETFLCEYDPKNRKIRGVYYTPEPVVSYIVRSVDHLLKSEFNLKKGLADASKVKLQKGDNKDKKTTEVHKVLILDPACGTGTFLFNVIDHIYDDFKGNRGMWSGYVAQHLLPRIFGFELLMAPYAVSHMKLGLQLDESGYDFKADERLRIYLTNTLEEAEKVSEKLTFARWLAEEAGTSNQIKRDLPIMVVLGNPPYSGHSANASYKNVKVTKASKRGIITKFKKIHTWIGKLLQDYYFVDGKPLGEKNPKWLQDDYVKFIRFAQWRIERTGFGVLAFITNHGYLDNPTFRGMRQSLMRTFDQIHVLDLHGNTKKKEVCPDGSQDNNVFDIKQGVAIGIFIKTSNSVSPAKVFHADLWGVREVVEDGKSVGGKYHWLWQNDISTTKWTKLQPKKPFYLFVPQDTKLLAEYEQGCKITDIMPVNVMGFQTHRDHFAIDFAKDELMGRIKQMRNSEMSDHEFSELYKLKNNRDWQLDGARGKLRADKDWQKKLLLCSYRPYDERFCYFDEVAMDYPRRELLDHVAGKNNICLGLGRQGQAVSDPVWSLVNISKAPIDANIFRRGGINVFPLYIYRDSSKVVKEEMFEDWPEDKHGRVPNLSHSFVDEFSEKLNLKFVTDGMGDLKKTYGPEDILHYIYAIFHSPTYRSRNSAFLKIDFPRVPLTSDKKLFRKQCQFGQKLISLHLMDHTGPNTTKYPVKGDDVVEKVRYVQPKAGSALGQVWINKKQYFDRVPPEVWEFHIGGYQVCEKWLKDRKGRKLSYDDLTRYQHIVSAIAETLRIMKQIDESIPHWPLD